MDETRLPERQAILAGAQELGLRLSRELKRPVRLTITDNRTSIVSFKRAPGVLALRLHHMFLAAPEHVVTALAEYAGRGAHAAGTVLDDFIRLRQSAIRRERTLADTGLASQGRVFNLQEIFERLNQAHFDGRISASIGWGRATAGARRRRSIRLGVYDARTQEIRIHPSLDRPEVPALFVEFVVFHEMLHQIYADGAEPERAGRRRLHSRAFRARERTFPHFEMAQRWERDNLGLLLRG
jgi:hypothetical protein